MFLFAYYRLYRHRLYHHRHHIGRFFSIVIEKLQEVGWPQSPSLFNFIYWLTRQRGKNRPKVGLRCTRRGGTDTLGSNMLQNRLLVPQQPSKCLLHHSDTMGEDLSQATRRARHSLVVDDSCQACLSSRPYSKQASTGLGLSRRSPSCTPISRTINREWAARLLHF